MPDSYLFTAAIPPAAPFRNADLNPLGQAGDYAGTYTHATDEKIRRVVREIIYDSTPKQFLDLSIMGLKQPERVDSDEFFYHEVGFGRDPFTTSVLGVEVAAGATQTLLSATTTTVSVDTMIIYPDNTKANITAIDPGVSITVKALGGETLPVLAAGSSYRFALLSPIETDSANSISQYYRVDTTERSNYVQMLIKAVRFGRLEAYKYSNARNTQNFMDIIKQKMLFQFRVDLANLYWNGQKGEVTLASGAKAKSMGGIFPSMVAAGSPNDDVTLVNAPDALEDLILDTEFGAYGDTRFLYMAPRVKHYLAQEYKRDLTRYTVGDKTAMLQLDAIEIGSTKVVFVPVKRFEEPSCFPVEFASKMILLDQESITPAFIFPEEMGQTGDRSRGFYNNYIDDWISVTASIYFNNPLGGGWLDITDLT